MCSTKRGFAAQVVMKAEPVNSTHTNTCTHWPNSDIFLKTAITLHKKRQPSVLHMFLVVFCFPASQRGGNCNSQSAGTRCTTSPEWQCTYAPSVSAPSTLSPEDPQARATQCSGKNPDRKHWPPLLLVPLCFSPLHSFLYSFITHNNPYDCQTTSRWSSGRGRSLSPATPTSHKHGEAAPCGSDSAYQPTQERTWIISPAASNTHLQL